MAGSDESVEFAAAGDAAIVMDARGRVVDFNPAAEATLGCTGAVAIEAALARLIPFPLGREARGSYPEAAAGLDARHLANRRIEGMAARGDGSLIPVELVLACIGRSEAALFLVLVRDLSQEKRLEAARRESDDRIRFALGAANMVAWDWDLPGGKIVRSENSLDLPCVDRSGIQAFRDRVYPDDRPAVEKAIERAIAGRAAYDIEYRLSTPSSQIRWVRDRAQVTFDEAGAPLRMAGICVDVTEHKQTVAALHAGEKRFRAMIEKSWDGVALLALDGRIQYASPAISRILGYTPDEIGAPNVLESVHPDDWPAVSDRIARLLAQPGSSTTFEYRTRYRDGSWRWVEVTCTNLLADASVKSIVANFREVTERRLAEHQLREFATQLERSNRELQEFAYVASHDLQEPLRKIEAFGDRISARCGDALGPDGSDYLERMQKAASRMRTLIQDLLAFSRVTTKARPSVPVDLAVVAREVVSDLEARIEQTGGTVALEALPTVEADPTQMRQLLQNLIGNALKFHHPDQAPRVTVRCADVDALPADGVKSLPAPPLVQLSVYDNGIGFDEKYVDRIFNPFQRLHGRGEYEGTGIGLAICRKIAERHGGSITAESAPGRGSVFSVTLPRWQPCPPAPGEGEANRE